MVTLKIPQATKRGYIEVPVGGIFDASYPNSKTRRGRYQGGLCPTLTAGEPEIYPQFAKYGKSEENWYFVDGQIVKYVNGKRI